MRKHSVASPDLKLGLALQLPLTSRLRLRLGRGTSLLPYVSTYEARVARTASSWIFLGDRGRVRVGVQVVVGVRIGFRIGVMLRLRLR